MVEVLPGTNVRFLKSFKQATKKENKFGFTDSAQDIIENKDTELGGTLGSLLSRWPSPMGYMPTLRQAPLSPNLARMHGIVLAWMHRMDRMVCACVVDMQYMISLRAVIEIRGMGALLLVVGGISLPVLRNHK